MARPLLRGAHQQLNRMAGVSPSTKTFTPKQGQYLAYILYPPLYAIVPQTSGRNRHPGIFPRQPAFGSLDGAGAERAGLITRQPRTPRSIEVLVDSKLWPELI